MDNKELAEYLDQQRWLMNNGLITDAVKNQLFFCGSIVHTEILAVEMAMSPDKRLVDYKVYVPSSLIKKIVTYQKLSTTKSLIGLWRFKRFLKKEGDLDFARTLNRFVKDYCGTKWTAKVEVLDFAKYAPGDEGGNVGEGWAINQFPDSK